MIERQATYAKRVTEAKEDTQRVMELRYEKACDDLRTLFAEAMEFEMNSSTLKEKFTFYANLEVKVTDAEQRLRTVMKEGEGMLKNVDDGLNLFQYEQS